MVLRYGAVRLCLTHFLAGFVSVINNNNNNNVLCFYFFCMNVIFVLALINNWPLSF